MALSGSYTLVRTEGVLEHLIATGMPENRAKEAAERGKNIEISIAGDNVILRRPGDLHPEQTLTLNQEIEEKVPGGIIIKTKALLNGNVLLIDSNTTNGNWKREYALSGSELIVTLSSSKPGVPIGKKIYKKD